MTKYINKKVKILADFGLTDGDALIDYLTRESAKIERRMYKERHIDFLCRELIEEFYNGSLEFVEIVEKF